jgi:hypothetical protein
MNSTKEDKKSQAQTKRGENPPFVIEDFLTQIIQLAQS